VATLGQRDHELVRACNGFIGRFRSVALIAWLSRRSAEQNPAAVKQLLELQSATPTILFEFASIRVYSRLTT